MDTIFISTHLLMAICGAVICWLAFSRYWPFDENSTDASPGFG